MEKKELLEVLIDTAALDLEKVNDPYQHGMLTIAIMDAYAKYDVVPNCFKNNNDKNSNKQLKEQKTELAAKPVSQKQEKEIEDILNTTSRAEEQEEEKHETKPENVIPTKDDLKNEPPQATNLNPEAKINVAEIVNNSAATEKEKEQHEENKAEIDITSPQWTEKHLTTDELDNTWTPAMRANKPLVESFKRLKRVCTDGIKSGKITVQWLNERIAECTGKHIMDFRTKHKSGCPAIFNPRAVMIIESYVSKKVTELFKNAA